MSKRMRLAPFVVAVGGVLSGCMTLNYDAPGRAVPLPATDQVPLRARLVISHEFREAAWKDEFQVSIGAALTANAENLVRTIFEDVEIGETNAPRSDGVVVTPRFVAIARDRPALATQDQRTDIIVEWAVSDAEGRPIWIETVSGHGHAPLSRADEQFDAALADLFRKSHREMSGAVEIRAHHE